ncbi:MAG TPA: DUF3857 domain-containing protein [Prolixibacteraceae bacterium]|nr:DUF3857 domain-containing protein [Prolixibacteraceae bacterium]
MKKYSLLVLVFLILSALVYGKEFKYKVADIPKELKENARSIVRNEEIVLEVKSQGSAKETVTYAITILNKNGLADASFIQFFDKFIRISNIEGRVFDENGEQIKRITANEILNASAISGISIYEDNRVKYIDPKVRNYPFTVEYSYEKSYDGLFSYPSWFPQSKYNLAVEKSSYKVIIAKDLQFRYLERHPSFKVTTLSDAQNNIYYWEARNLKAIDQEPYSLPDGEIFPGIITAPTDFEIEGYKGNLDSWENFGMFVSNLNEGKTKLDNEVKKELNSLVAGISDEYEKIAAIYKYMQDRTRYVSIQIGLGGWQPIDASTVHRLSYGDCKALSNYMKAMLEAVGIKSYYCLVNAGPAAPKMIREFPSTQFNHAFLCVPLKTDTVWLECTSQRMPCGYIGTFTDDRDILLIDHQNSKVVHSKVYDMSENMETRTSYVRIDENGKGTVQTKALYKGLKYDDMLRTLLADDKDKKRLIAERMKFPGFQVIDFKYLETKGFIPSIEEIFNVNFENYITTMGARQLLLLNFSNQVKNRPSHLRSRKTDVYIKRSSIDIDTIVYELPLALTLESLPKPVFIANQFGKFEAKTQLLGNKVIYVRRFQINKGLFPAADYAAFVDFFDKINEADGLMCVLIKN